MINLDCGLKTIERILHVSDIHIRNLKRHEEYRHVFKNLYMDFRQRYQPNDVIVVSGDIAHAKTEMSPELVGMISEFLVSLCEIAPTFIITGNHDCNLNNSDRLDVLTPIIQNLKNKNLFYLRDSGVYRVSNVDFAVYSRLDSTELWPKVTECSNQHNIALYHGVVNGCISDTGMVLTSSEVKLDLFDGYDMVLLGDIHKQQRLQELNPTNKKPIVEYAGSLIQQNHGESLNGHGYLLWHLDSRINQFIEIKNDWGFCTIKVKNGIIENNPNIPKKPRIRIQLEETKHSEISRIITDIRKQYHVEYVSIANANIGGSGIKTEYGDPDSVIGDIFDVNHQNEILSNYINSNFSEVDNDLLSEIITINNKLNGEVVLDDLNRNVRIKLKRLEFSNMFSFGENNTIIFENLKDVVGLFAQNASGKSSIIEILLFALFDKCSKTSKALDILNTQKKWFSCMVQFEIDGMDYFIKREGHKQGNKTIFLPVSVDFWRQHSDGTIDSLNGEQRRDTDHNIQKYVGTYDNFILTAISLQNNNSGLIDKGQSDRKNLIASFLGLDIYEKLCSIAKEKVKEVEVILKQFLKSDFSSELAEVEKELETLSNEDAILTKDLVAKKNLLQRVNDMISEYNRSIKHVDGEEFDIEELETEKTKYANDIDKIEQNLTAISGSISTLKSESYEVIEKFKTYDIELIKKGNSELALKSKEKTQLVLKSNTLKTDLDHKQDKLDKLKSLEYDEDCTYCMNNIFVKDAIKTKELFEEDALKYEQVKRDITEIDTNIQELKKYEVLMVEYNDLKSSVDSIKNKYQSLKNQESVLQSNLELNKKSLQITNNNINTYHTNIATIETNQEYFEKIEKLKGKKIEVEQSIDDLNEKLKRLHSNITISERTKTDLNEKMETVQVLEKTFKAYDYYLKCVGKDGIPYDLISRVIPIFETNVNSILSQLADFNIVFQLDDKDIDAYIVYGDGKCWSLNLTSGMEKFISSIAIRSALMSVSNIPKPNFLMIDEGFGVADIERMTAFPALFAFLANNYDFILIVSHIDYMKECVTLYLDLDKIDGFSHIDNSKSEY